MREKPLRQSASRVDHPGLRIHRAMWSLFKSPRFSDPLLGEFLRSRGYWRGAVKLDDSVVPLILAGDRTAPNLSALELARSLPNDYAAWRPTIASALFEHYQPYRESATTGELDDATPTIDSPGDVWSHIAWSYASILPAERSFEIEFGLTAAWDEEHQLGARFREGRFVELCGSVLPP